MCKFHLFIDHTAFAKQTAGIMQNFAMSTTELVASQN
jgi:hypothetical protein